MKLFGNLALTSLLASPKIFAYANDVTDTGTVSANTNSALKFEFSGKVSGKKQLSLNQPGDERFKHLAERRDVPGAQSTNQNFPSVLELDALTNNLTLTTSYNFYLTNVTFGEPGQQLELGFDTGSPYLWVYGPNGSFGDAPMFYPSKSSTYQQTNKSFSGLYGAGAVYGKWGIDNLQIANGTLNQFPFGVIESFQISAGVPGLIGLGPNYENLTSRSYSNVPEALYLQNVTSSPAFSVYLDDATGGGVIFGGIDKSRYEGPFYDFDIAKIGSRPTYYYQLHLNGLGINDSRYDVFNTAILDTGSPFCQLPYGFVDQVGQSLNLTFNNKYRTYYAPEGQKIVSNSTIHFKLGNFEVDIPISEFIVPGEYVWVDDGPKNVQALGLMSAPQYVLGDGFFRGIYAVLDSMHKKIYLAKSAGGNNGTFVPQVEDLPVSGIPGAKVGPISVNTKNPYTYPTATSYGLPTNIATSAPLEENMAQVSSGTGWASEPVTTLEVTMTTFKTMTP